MASRTAAAMAPRPYQLGRRQAAVDETRARILAGTRELLVAEDGFARFTMDAIAKQTDVARMTVYNQFKNKAELLEALFDDLAEKGRLPERLRKAFAREDAVQTAVGFIFAFTSFFNSEREVMRKLNGLSVLDPVFAEVSREHRRQSAAREVLQRLKRQTGKPDAKSFQQAEDVFVTLTSFDTIDRLATGRRSARQVALLLCRLLGAYLDLDLAADSKNGLTFR
jgi:AcrR family transcriptional regulator